MSNTKLACLLGVLSIVLFSCSAKKSQPGSSDRKIPSQELSISPSTFSCVSVIFSSTGDDSSGCRYYFVIIEDVLRRGSSLLYQPAQHDSLQLKDCNSRFHRELRTGDTLIASVEERLTLNSEMPEFILRQVVKQ